MSHTYYHPYREQTFAIALLYRCCYFWCNYYYYYLLAVPPTQLRKTRSHHQREQSLLLLMICSIHERLTLQFRTLILRTLDVGFMSEAILIFLMCFANLLPSIAQASCCTCRPVSQEDDCPECPVWMPCMPYSLFSKPNHPKHPFYIWWKFIQQFLNHALMEKQNFILLT